MLLDDLPDDVRRSIIRATPDPLSRRLRRLAHGEAPAQRRLRSFGTRIARGRAALSQQARVDTDPALVPVSVGGRPAQARVVAAFRASEVLAANAALVADALERHDVDYFVLRAEPQIRRVIVVAEPQREAAVAALVADLGPRGGYGAVVQDRRIRRVRRLQHTWANRASSVRVFQFVATADGDLLSGSELGCDLQFWRVADASTPVNGSGEPIAAGSLLGPRTNDPVPDVIPPSEQTLVHRPVDGTPRPQLALRQHPGIFQISEPIDVVYTWVDGDDPAWRRRKAETLAESHGTDLHALAVNDSRFQSHDELRYSLRSLDMYADWVRQVFLVTDDQVPAWLDTSNPRMRVVSHRELFGDRGRLPTFNSHAIESQLHRIDGLAENYLYLNDDVFFARPARPDSFVLANGLAKFFLSVVKIAPGPVRLGDLPVTSAAKNNRDLLLERFGRTVDHKFRHMPHSLRRSVMFDLERDFAEPVAATAQAQFRDVRDISLSAALGHYYGFLTGRAVQGRLSYRYYDIGHPDTADHLSELLRRRNYDIFCLNDHDSSQVDPALQATMLRHFLDRYFPLPSQYEL